jgi:hypothetical protein
MEAISAHLGLEELILGDSETDFEMVWKHLDQAIRISNCLTCLIRSSVKIYLSCWTTSIMVRGG